MSAIFALCAAFSNALYVATQHVASTSGRVGKASGLRLVAYLIRSPLWLFGWAAALGAFVFQAAALKNGQLSIVQALLVTELVFGLLLRKVWIGQAIRPAAWGSAALTCVGLAAFVIVDQPQGGTPTPTAHAWAGALAAFGGAAAVMTLAARWGSPRRQGRALRHGRGHRVGARGHVHQDGHRDADRIRHRRGVHRLAGIRIGRGRGRRHHPGAGGPSRRPSQRVPAAAGDRGPLVSVVLSIWLFQERYTRGPAAIAGSLLAFAVMCLGVVALTRTAPSTMRAPPSP